MRKLLLAIAMLSLCSCDAIFLKEDEGLLTYQENVSLPEQLEDGIETALPITVGIDMTSIEGYIHSIHEGEPSNRVRSILIARDNKLVLESYFNGWNRERKQDIRSATKSITSALIGIAIDKQILPGEDAKILDFLDEYESLENWDDRKSDMRIRDFLRMRTGLSCNDWRRSSPGNEENMYETDDWIRFVLDLPMSTDPGTSFSYCTGAPVTLGAILANASGERIPDFAHEHLFSHLAITDYSWETMPNGRTDTGGHLHLRPRDMLKLGLLFLNKGSWQGQQVISESWVERSTEPTGRVGGQEYGYLWWSTSWDIEGREISAHFASGNGGQLIFIVPEMEAVVVFTGGQYGENWLPGRLNLMENIILPSFQ